MRFAYTMMEGKGDMDLLLAQLASTLSEQDVRVAGAVQINTECGPDRPCDMDLELLPSGRVLRISQTLGVGARGCRLDPDALETAVGLLTPEVAGADLLIINKFGKHEASGRGFRPVIAEAISAEVPVLCGVNGLNVEAFQAFAEGAAEQLAPDLNVLRSWVLNR